MNTANLNTLIQRYEDNFEWINNAEHDEIFKWRALPRNSKPPQKSALCCSIMGRYPPQTGS